MIRWLKDKEKNGEVFSNSECLTYVVKYFMDDKRVELWGEGKGMSKKYETEEEARNIYEEIKKQDYINIWRNTQKMMK